MSEGIDLRPSRKARLGTVLLVLVIHILAVVAIIRAFTPDLASIVTRTAMDTLTVIISTPEQKEEPEPEADSGAAAPEAPKAKPREQSAPKQKIPAKPQVVPPVSSRGDENASGAAAAGAGTGGGGAGAGTGSGAEGDGAGNSAVRGVEKIAGDINSARDYPKKTRDLRLGHSVTILLTIGTDGRASDCRVSQPSPDPQADQITCKLAIDRFRFRPAVNRKGDPVRGQYAWRQRWFQ